MCRIEKNQKIDASIIQSKYIYSDEILSPSIHITKGGKYSIADNNSKTYKGATKTIEIDGYKLTFIGGILVEEED